MATLSEAIATIKAGQRDEGRVMLTRILTLDGNSVSALLWMTEVATTPEERRTYLERVLAIDPTNAPARRGLEILGKSDKQPPLVPTTQSRISQPTFAVTAGAPKKSTDEVITQEAIKPCPFCGKAISAGSSYCNFCGRNLNAMTMATSVQPRRLPVRPKYIALLGGIVMIAGSLLSGIAMIVGSLMPWETISSVYSTIHYMDAEGDGIFTLVIGVLVVVAALVAKETPGTYGSVLAGIFSLLGGILSLIDLFGVSSITGYVTGVSSPVGAGMYVIFIGAVVGVIGGFMRNPGKSRRRNDL